MSLSIDKYDFVPVFKPHTHKLCILVSIYIVNN